MGVLGTIVAAGIAITLGVSWVTLKRTQLNRKRIINIEQRLQGLRDFEGDTLQKVRQLLHGLDEKIGEDSQINQTAELSVLRTKIKELQNSISEISEDRGIIDQRAYKWLYENRTELAHSAAEITLKDKSEYLKYIDDFSAELVSCLSMTAKMIRIDNQKALSKVWNGFPKNTLPVSFYVIAIREVTKLTQSDPRLIAEEKAKIKSYFDNLIAHRDD